jgi:tetratricopeptide (TPR) repeat protein
MIGQVIDGRYHIIRPLDAGGFAKTFIAEDSRRPGRPQCVVKRLQPSQTDPHTLEVSRRLFQREAEVLERLGHHAQIPRLLANFEENKEFYLVEELIVGHPLSQEIVTGQPLPEMQVMGILTEILDILVFVHGQGVIHRDIKPSNIIRQHSDGRLFLIDFGAVKEVTTQVVGAYGGGSPTVVGTQGYMPLEQFHGHPRFNSDLYALGIIAIQALTGLPANNISTLRDPHYPDKTAIVWHHRAPYTNPRLTNIIDRLVVFDPTERYQSATDVLNDLRTVTYQPPVEPTLPVPPVPPIPPVVSSPKNKLGLILGGVGASVLLLGGMGFGANHYFQQKSISQGKQAYYQGLEKVLQKDYKGAILSLDEAIKINPKYGEAYYQRCLANYFQDKENEAIQDCTQAISYLPKDYNSVGIYLKVDEKTKDLTISGVQKNSPAANANLKEGEKILEIAGKSTENLSVGQAEDLLRDGQADSSVKLKIGNADGTSSELTLKLAKLANDQFDLAYNYRGLSKFYTKDYKGAIADFDEAIRIYPNYFRYHYNRGRARSKQGDKQGSIQDFDQAIELNGSYAAAYSERALIRQFLGQPEAAIKDFDKAIELEPNNAVTYFNRGESYLSLGNKQAAISDYTKAIEIDPKNVDAYLARCGERSNIGNHQEALADCNKVIELSPNSSAGYTNRGLVYDNLRDNQKAIADYTQAIKLDPNSTSAYNNRGNVRKALGDKQGAIEDYTKAIEINPNKATAYYNRGRLYGEIGRREEGIEDLRKAAQIYLQGGLRGGYNQALAEIAKLEKQPAQTPN